VLALAQGREAWDSSTHDWYLSRLACPFAPDLRGLWMIKSTAKPTDWSARRVQLSRGADHGSQGHSAGQQFGCQATELLTAGG